MKKISLFLATLIFAISFIMPVSAEGRRDKDSPLPKSSASTTTNKDNKVIKDWNLPVGNHPLKIPEGVTYSSSDEKIVSINNADGRVIAHKEGTCRITYKRGSTTIEFGAKVTPAPKKEKTSGKLTTIKSFPFPNNQADSVLTYTPEQVDKAISFIPTKKKDSSGNLIYEYKYSNAIVTLYFDKPEVPHDKSKPPRVEAIKLNGKLFCDGVTYKDISKDGNFTDSVESLHESGIVKKYSAKQYQLLNTNHLYFYCYYFNNQNLLDEILIKVDLEAFDELQKMYS